MDSLTSRPSRRAAIYCRVSTAGQREDGTSLDSQREACLEQAARLGFSVPADLVFAEDWPGTAWERPLLDRARELVREGAIDALIAYSTDRLARDPILLGVIAQECDRRAVALVLVTEPIDGSSEGQLLSFVRGWAAKLEHAKIRERSIRGKREAARQGKLVSGSVPYGYRYLPGEGRCEIHPEHAKIVEQIFRWYADGVPQRSIAQRLTDMGVPAPSSGSGEKKKGGARWHTSSIARALTNPSYTGRVEAFRWINVEPLHPGPQQRRYTKTRKEPRPPEERIAIEGAIPAIISVDLWDAAQAMRVRNRAAATRNTRREYLLSGHIICSWCRRRYGAMTCRGHAYYYCPGAKSTARAERCRNRRLNGRKTEEDVWGRVLAALSDPHIIADELQRRREAAHRGEGAEQDLAAIESALRRNGEQERRLVKLFQFGEIDEEVIRNQIRGLKAERDRLQRERDQLNARLASAAAEIANLEQAQRYVDRVRARLQTLDFTGKRLALQALGVTIVVDGDDYRVEALIPTETGEYCTPTVLTAGNP